MGRQAIEHLSLGFLNHKNRYDTHLLELQRNLSSIPTHIAEDHLLLRFVSELPRSFGHPWLEHRQVEVMDTLEVRAGVRHDNIMLITESLLGTPLTDAEVVAGARAAESIRSRSIDDVCRLAVANQRDYAWLLPMDEDNHTVGIEEYVVPTVINGVVLGFSGPAVRGTDSPSSEFTLTFYSVPPEQ